MGARNKVIAGDYCGYDVIVSFGKVTLMHRLAKTPVDKTSLLKWELVDSQNASGFWGSFLRGYVSQAFLGTAGLFASAARSATARNYLISLEFVDGKRSLLEIDDRLYKKLVPALY